MALAARPLDSQRAMPSDFFRTYLPLNNPAGFGVADTLIFAAALILVLIVLASHRLERFFRWLAAKPLWCLSLIAVLPILLRLALLRLHPAPTPNTADDFSYLLLGDTLAHFRLANPVHPLHQFFETVFVLQEPSYSSIFPLGQGIVLAAGQLLFRQPWAGVLASIGGLCAMTYWMLRAWTTPVWALLGGLLAVCEFGPLNQWANSYWGGALSGIAGCLVFGALARLRVDFRNRYAALLGAGIGVEILTRPFESTLLILSVLLFLGAEMRRPGFWRIVLIAAAAGAPALGLTLLQNRAVSGSWSTLPYVLSRYEYGVPTTFTVQPNPVPHRKLTREQEVDYEAQRLVHGEGTDTPRAYVSRLGYRLRFYRFFFYSPLCLALPFSLLKIPGLLRIREFRVINVAFSALIFVFGTNFYPYFQPQYIAALTCVFVLLSVTGLEQLSRWPAGRKAARIILLLCAGQFAFWYGVHLWGNESVLEALTPYETWDYINWGDADGRIAIDDALAVSPGQQLVFVRYSPRHLFEEWIHNGADIDGSHVVYAADLGTGENEKLRRYYSGRTAWMLEPDARPPRLKPYPEPEAPPSPPPNRVSPSKSLRYPPGRNPFEEVR